MTYILGAKKFVVLASEDIWGSNPNDSSGSGSAGQQWVHIPVTTYDVRFRPENRQANPFTGIFQRKHSRNFRGMPSGALTCPLYGWIQPGVGASMAEYLMSWAFGNHEDSELPSKTAQWYEAGAADKEHNGLRVNGATLSGSEDSSVIELSLDLMGKTESTDFTAQSLLDDRNKLVDFEFSDASFSLGGSSILLESFSVSIQNGLITRYLNSFTPSLLLKTTRVITVQMTPIKESDTYDAYRRSSTSTELAGQITLKGLHNGTGSSGNYSQVVIDFDRLGFVDADETGGRDELASQPLNFIALKPDTSNNEMRMTWSEVE